MKKIIIYSLMVAVLIATAFYGQAQKINVNLSVNGGTEATVFNNEAVLVDVAVFNKKAQADQRWNRAGEERLAELEELRKNGGIKQADYDREKTNIEKNRRTSPGTVLGSATSSWTSAIRWKAMNTAKRSYTELPLKLMKKPSTEGRAVLDAEGYYIACYGISPDDMKIVPAGTYAIECIINNIICGTAVLKVQNGMMDAAKANSEPVLLHTGQYYWHAEDGDKTVEYAERVLSKNPSSLDGLSMLADGLLLQKKYQLALEAYKKSASEYYKQNGAGAEPPEYTLTMIEVVKKQIGQ